MSTSYGYWSTISEFLPNYYFRDDVLLSDILARYIDDEEIFESDLEMINSVYGGDKQKVKEALFKLDARLIVEAMKELYGIKDDVAIYV